MFLSLLLALVSQEESPADVLKRISEQVAAAKSLRVRVSCEVTYPKSAGAPPDHVKGELLLKDGRRAKVSLDRDISPLQQKPLVILADGPRIEGMDELSDLKEPGEALHRCFRSYLPHLGVLSGRMALRLPREPNQLADGLHLRPKQVEQAVSEGELKCLTYKVDGAAIKLWYNPAGLLPKKLKVECRDSVIAEIVEQYEEFSLNVVLPDEIFQLPKVKKER